MSSHQTILIAGVGGQGTLLASTVIGSAAVESGLRVRVAETFGMSQRGGSVVTHIRLGAEIYSPIIPLGSAELIVGFEPLEAYRNVSRYLRPGGKVILNIRPVHINGSDTSAHPYPLVSEIIRIIQEMGGEVFAFDATALALQAGGTIMMNMVMLGATASLLSLSIDSIRNTVLNVVNKQVEANLRAFDLGLAKIEELLPAGVQ